MPHIECPDCSNPLKVGPDCIGETVTCPACGRTFVLTEPGTPPVVPKVTLQPADDEYADDDDRDDAPPSPPVVDLEPLDRPGSMRPWIGLFGAALLVFVIFVIRSSNSSEHATDTSNAPLLFDDDSAIHDGALREVDSKRELANYHRVWHKLRDTESEIESLQERHTTHVADGSAKSTDLAPDDVGRLNSLTAELPSLKASCHQIETLTFPYLSSADLMKECCFAKEDLQMAEVALQYPDKNETEQSSTRKKKQIAELQAHNEQLESLLSTHLKGRRAASAGRIFETGTLDERLEHFQQLDFDKAQAIHHQAWDKHDREQAELLTFQARLHHDFIEQCVIEFGRRIPANLIDAFLRKTSRGYRDRSEVQVSNMNASDHKAAREKQAADDKRLEQQQQEYEVELSHKLPDSVNYIASETDLAQLVKGQAAKVDALRSECERLEAAFLSRIDVNLLVSEYQRTRLDLQAAENKLASLSDRFDTASVWSSEDENPTLANDFEIAFRDMIDRADKHKRSVQSSSTIQQNGLPDALKRDVAASDLDRQSAAHDYKCTTLRARRDRIKALLKAKGMNL
jgi:hypothetical protein